MKRGVAALLALIVVAPAWGGELIVDVVTPEGAPVADAVATLPSAKGAPKAEFPWKMEIAQRNKAFEPFVLIAPAGTSVTFPNLDKFRHHVYSFSKGNKFELELFGREEKRSYVFKTEGVAALGCNIHDEMVAYVRVVDTPWAAKSDATGAAVIANAPAGAAKITVWHPHAKGRAQSVEADVQVSAEGSTRIRVVLPLSPPKAH
jgi:plastocyanin